MATTIRILYIDDNPLDRALVRDSLEKEHGGFVVREAKSKIEFEKLIHEENFDLVLTDFNILGFEGLQVLKTVKSIDPNLPVIIVTGTGSEEVAVESMKRGAGDYVIKSPKHISRLPNTILSVLETKRIRLENEKAQKDLAKMNRVYAVISQINQMIVRVREPEKLFREACNIAIQFGNFRMAWIGLIDEESQSLKPFCWSGYEVDFLTQIKSIQLDQSPEGKGSGGTAIRNGKYVVCNDLENDPIFEPWKEEALKRDYRSLISLPIKRNKIVIGTFNIYSDETKFFDPQEIILLEEVVEDLSFALDSIHTSIEMEKAEKELKINHAKYKTLFELLPLGITISDNAGNIIESNAEAERLLGISKELQEKRAIDGLEWKIIRTDGTQMPAEEFASVRALKEDKTVYNVEMGVDKGAGFITWINVSATPIPLENYGVMIIYFDITERKENEKELITHRNHLEELVKDRTVELEKKNNDLERFNNLFVGRELRIKELKDKLKDMEGKLKG